MNEAWKNFKEGKWTTEINVQDFIKNNYKSYKGDESFLEEKTEKTTKIWNKCSDLLKEELQKHVLDIEMNTTSGISCFKPGYISKEDDVVVGLQTDAPLKRIINPYGGIRMVYQELEAYGYKLDETIDEHFNKYRKTHNQGVFDTYTEDIRKARHVGLLTGLPDAYGRGRIIGDYRRIALYGIDFLIEKKKEDLKNYEHAKQVLKMSGLSLKESSSGQKKGKKHISKRGRSKLRRNLKQIGICLVGKNNFFLQLHNYYTTEREHPLTKLVSINAIIRKFMYILMAIVKSGNSFNEEKAIRESCINFS